VRDSPSTAFFGIILKVSLHGHFLVVVSNNFNGLFVSTDRSWVSCKNKRAILVPELNQTSI
jgi:hypothetical protein